MSLKRITVLRSGEPSPLVDEGHQAELMRALTAKGVDQILSRRMQQEYEEYDLVLSSPAAYAVHSAHFMSGKEGEEIVKLDELFWASESPLEKALKDMGRTLRIAPFKQYREHAHGGLILQHGQRAWWKVLGAMNANPDAKSVLVVGHNLLILGMGYAAASKQWMQGHFDVVIFLEAQGYTLEFDGPRPVSLSFLK